MFVGIDVSKDRLDVHLRPSGEAFAVARDGPGLEALVVRLAAAAPTLVVLEATGGFEQTVAAALAAASLPLAVVNPAQVRAFARATGRLAKTDRLDAVAIARFAEAVRPEPRPVASEHARTLAERVARRRQVVEMIGMESNRRRAARSPRVLRGIERTLAALAAALTGLDDEIGGTIRGTPPGARPRTCSPPSPASARSPPAPSSPNCPNSARSTAAASPPSSASPPSTATAEPCAATAPSPAAARACATPCTWRH